MTEISKNTETPNCAKTLLCVRFFLGLIFTPILSENIY